MEKVELEFRAWNHKAKTMYHDVCIVPTGHATDGVSYITYDKEKDAVMQYSGKKDKNDKKIFDGDLVRVYTEPSQDKEHYGESSLFKVTRDITSWGYEFSWDNISGYACSTHIMRDAEEGECGCNYEVVGNIYENPNLIK